MLFRSLAYDLQRFKTGQLVKAEEVQVEIVAKQKQIELQEQEIKRKERELQATVQKPAEAERQKVETLANARKFQLETEANGAANAAKATGFANADVAKATGLAEAEANKARGLANADVAKATGLAQAAVIEAQGKATAEATRLKAEAFQQYNEAAVIELLVKVMPEIAGKISEPLSKTEKMVIINSGSGPGGGASKLTGDVTQIIAQLPPVLESLTGIRFEKLLEQVPALKKAMAKDVPPGSDKAQG